MITSSVDITRPYHMSRHRMHPVHQQCVIEHIAAHILHDDLVDHSSEPYRLCLRPLLLCKIMFKTTKGWKGHVAIDIKLSLCPNLIKFSITNAAACSESSPCTNHPMRCPYCPKSNPAVWSYNFRHHLLCVHPSIHLGNHKAVWAPLKLEKDGMKHIWQHWHKQPKPHQRAQRPPLVISETHHTHLVLRYIFHHLPLSKTTNTILYL